VGLLLSAAELWLPEIIQRRQLGKLFSLTARTFGCPAPRLVGLSRRTLLHEFASFTRDRTLRCLPAEAPAVRERLYSGAYDMGADLRRVFAIRAAEEVMQAARVAYRVLDIDLTGSVEGQIIIRRCFFSPYYPNSVCQFISALDEGLLAGLSDGWWLRFQQRITDGSECCRAWLGSAEVKQ